MNKYMHIFSGHQSYLENKPLSGPDISYDNEHIHYENKLEYYISILVNGAAGGTIYYGIRDINSNDDNDNITSQNYRYYLEPDKEYRIITNFTPSNPEASYYTSDIYKIKTTRKKMDDEFGGGYYILLSSYTNGNWTAYQEWDEDIIVTYDRNN